MLTSWLFIQRGALGVVLQLWLCLLVSPLVALGEEGTSLSLLCVREGVMLLEFHELGLGSQDIIQQLVRFATLHCSFFHFLVGANMWGFEHIHKDVPW